MSAVLTKSRLSNAFRCYADYALGRLGLVRSQHMPLFVSVEPASVCQLRCPECPVGQRADTRLSRNAFMPREVWTRVLREAADTAAVFQFYFQGEPLLNPALPQMIADARRAGVYTILSTNAQALTPEMADSLLAAGLNRIIVSMDGLSQSSYGAYRIGGDIARCKDALRFLHEAKKRTGARTIVELQCLRLKTNEHEWTALRRSYKALGADRLTFKSAQLYSYASGHPLMPSSPRYSRYRRGADGRYSRKPLRKGCFRVWSGVVVTTDGELLPCCYDKSHEFSYGNIMSAPLASLFSGEKAVAFRRAAMREQPQICKECWK